MNQFSTIGIFSKPEAPTVGKSLHTLHQFLQDKSLQVIASEHPATILGLPACSDEDITQQADLAIVVGGDGTLLQAGRLLAAHDIPIVGINLGRVGFLVDVLPGEMAHQLSLILDGHFVEEQRGLLQAQACRGERLLGEGSALNDVVLHSHNAVRMIEFTTYIDGNFVIKQRADGLVVATATGSTAYALSSGGPILHPSLDANVLVPICPHTLSNRPIVINNQSQIEISLGSEREHLMDSPVDSRVSFDGHNDIELVSGDHITIRAGQKKMRLLHPKSYDYYHILRSKLHWGTQL